MPPKGPDYIDADRIDAILRPLVPGDRDRAFLLRCILHEGPGHHRGANYILVAMLGDLLEALGEGTSAETLGDVRPVMMRVPPHLAEHAPKRYPVGIPAAPLRALAGGDAEVADAMIHSLSDGPPQHALANAVMVSLLARAIATARQKIHD